MIDNQVVKFMLINKMTIDEAKKIGSKQGLISVSIGFVIAQLIMTFLFAPNRGFVNGFLWFTRLGFLPYLIIEALLMLLFGHLFGKIAGKEIIIKERNFVFVGGLTGVLVLFSTIFFTSWIAFIEDSIDKIGINSTPSLDYIYYTFEPIYWVILFGIIPSFIVGIWFGWQIRRKGKI